MREGSFAFLNTYGEPVTFRRITGTVRSGTSVSHTTSDTTVKAKFYRKKEQDQSGLVSQGTVNVKVAAQALGYRPVPDDKIIRGTEQYIIISVDARVDMGVEVLYIITAKGK